jgi:hypothetical protein
MQFAPLKNRILTAFSCVACLTIVSRVEASVVVPNTFGQGADAALGNDSGFSSTSTTGGTSGSMEIRAGDTGTSRNRLGIVRWDLSGVVGDRSGAIMRIFETGNNSRTVSVFGLNDGDAGETWSEASINYATAPAISLNAGPPPATSFDSTRTTLLGTFGTTGSTAETLSFSSAALDSFLAADTNNLVTLYFYRDGGGTVLLRTKESDPLVVDDVPTLELPNAVAAIPETSQIALMLVALVSARFVSRRANVHA